MKRSAAFVAEPAWSRPRDSPTTSMPSQKRFLGSMEDPDTRRSGKRACFSADPPPPVAAKADAKVISGRKGRPPRKHHFYLAPSESWAIHNKSAQPPQSCGAPGVAGATLRAEQRAHAMRRMLLRNSKRIAASQCVSKGKLGKGQPPKTPTMDFI